MSWPLCGSVKKMLLALARRWLQFLVALCVAPLGTATANADDIMMAPATVAKLLRKHNISPDDVSLYVHKLSEAAPLVAFNAEAPRQPASTIKVLTTKAGLDILGPTYTWKTEAYITGSVTGDRLDGDLIIKGYGDPNMTPEALWHLLWGVRERGVATIGGDLILDNSYFEPPRAGRGDFDGKPDSVYNALPSALSVNLQTTEIHLMQAGAEEGVRVFTDPPLANVTVDNRLELVAAPCKRKYHKPAVTLVQQGPRATLRLTGTFAADCGETSYTRLMLETAQHTAGAMVALWRDMGGLIQGAVREGALPAGARRIYVMESEPLEEIIRLINKPSNNLMARTLFLTLGAKRLGAPGTLPKARQAVKDWLEESGLDFPELVLDNGSGLSRDTRISARSMGRLLGYAYASPYMPELLSSLAVAGVDGTLRKRFRNSNLKGHAHMKTGTIRGATGIAGFMLDRQGERWIVVSLMSSPRLETWAGKAVENALLKWVYEDAGGEKRRVAVAGATTEQGLPGSPEPRIGTTVGDWFLRPDRATPEDPVRAAEQASEDKTKYGYSTAVPR